MSTLLNTRSRRILLHIGFWLIVWAVMTLIYGQGMPDLAISAKIMLLFLPIHLFYYYSIVNIGIYRFINRRKYWSFAFFLVGCLLLSALAFRLTEILIADPWILREMQKQRPDFQWHKLDGSFYEQLKKPFYIINAIEQSNLIVWVALSVKFFMMWFEKRQAAAEAELNFLKGQLHPHFLFNTLNNLYGLTLSQSPKSPEVVIGLSGILRYMLYEANTAYVDLTKDVEMIKSYIALEKIRYEERLEINFSINGLHSGYRIAPLLLLPLVENAFKHGAGEKVGDAWINMDLRIKDDKLKFKVSNSKPEHRVITDKERQGSSIGLTNIRKRLDILYPSAHKLRIIEEEEMFLAVLEIRLNLLTTI
ncbi:sensor histidine kinase [Dyadobacter helix]|uniref:sensor histidine kinase n=1 Tax=Dyadobacter helix TaxID=2822344 RepID=UPI001E4A6852|nr:histidine kinase [Dyadobacter sp. CECT 9275]